MVLACGLEAAKTGVTGTFDVAAETGDWKFEGIVGYAGVAGAAVADGEVE